MPIELKSVTHTYSEGSAFQATAIRNVSLTIEDGEFIAVVGHTGSGKSTLVQHLNGLLKPTGGQILIDGEDLNAPGADRRRIRQKGITVVWITHFMEEAAQADRVIVVSDGKIAREGTPREVFRHIDEMRSLHLDVPHMTALAKELREGGMPLREDILTVEEMAEEVARLLCPSN